MRDYRRKQKEISVPVHKGKCCGVPVVGEESEDATANYEAVLFDSTYSFAPWPLEVEEIMLELQMHLLAETLTTDNGSVLPIRDDASQGPDSSSDVDERKRLYFPPNPIANPMTPVGPGMSESFHAYPVSSLPEYDGYILNYCE